MKSTVAAGPLDRLEAGEALAHLLDLGVDRLGGYLGIDLRDLESLVVAQLGDRPHPDLDRELERIAVGGRIRHVELRVADRRHAGVDHRPFVPLRQPLAQRLLHDPLPADALEDELRRDLALAEASGPRVMAGKRGTALGVTKDGSGRPVSRFARLAGASAPGAGDAGRAVGTARGSVSGAAMSRRPSAFIASRCWCSSSDCSVFWVLACPSRNCWWSFAVCSASRSRASRFSRAWSIAAARCEAGTAGRVPRFRVGSAGGAGRWNRDSALGAWPLTAGR